MMSQGSEQELVVRYFDTHAADFDSIYEEVDKGAIRRIRDRFSRGTVTRRLEFVRELAARHRPRNVLDVGCGAGRFAIPLAMAGAEVVGLDFAPVMIEMASVRARAKGVQDRTEFLAEDYLSWSAPTKYDLSIATGVVDYMSNPEPLIAKMAADTRGLAVISFPKRWHPLVPLRKLRLALERCPVYFSTRSDVEAYCARHFAFAKIVDLDRDYLLIGQPRWAASR